MKSFEYAAPTSLAEVSTVLSRTKGTTRFLAGGTDLIVQLREHLHNADLVVDVKRIPELMALSYSADRGLRLGASVPCYRIYENAEVSQAYQALADATRIVGGWQIQCRASVGGNLCNSSPAGDTIAPLIALGARCEILGSKGTREVAAEDFCVAPGKNVLEPGEILTTLHFPPPEPRSGSAYLRFIPRNEMDIAVAGVASWIRLSGDGKTIDEARVAVAAVAPTPRFAAEASRWLGGKPATDETFAAAGELAKLAALPIDDMRGTAEFRVHLTGVLTKRTLAEAVKRALS